MKKFQLFLCLITVGCLLILIACGNESSSGNGKNSDETMKSADVVSETSPYTEGMNYFTEKVEDELKGKFKIKHFPAGKLGSDQEIVEGVKFGSIDFAITGTVSESKIAEAFYLPYLIKDEEHLEKVINGETAEKIKQRFEEETSGLKLVGMVYYAPRVLTTDGQKIKNLEDLKGLSIRVGNDQMSIDSWEAMGTSPSPIEFTELYTSLQTGVVDAQENPYEIILNNSFYEVQDTIIETYHSYPVRFFIMNEELYNSLSDNEKKVIEDTWKETASKIKKIYKDNEGDYIKQLKENGMNFIEIDKKPLIEATNKVREKYAIDAFGEDLYKEIRDLEEIN